MCYFFWPTGWIGGIIQMILGIILLEFLIFIGYKIINNVFLTNNNPLKILNEKLAKDEITEDEYLKMKKILKER
ncbi:hypothetical protein SU69_03525 [Thermosipho melanesiensis]|uniref:SHOCT domain-containing protein n=2 Tax=Thermosipho melanesiensis TaxID=46541 RepID=A6LKU6_THEM4|nr:SHOCT domain-containing protein [Thermosipho melanesiensis]ABR30547.1 hypothetical protein Tmel_0683 [Thermosipho melanesiensis BI429]APT73696.1 hypothetical protein BW47_03710 [Thermosipho melanesiensis]OOC35634.1 hypothetical protein SU68_03580 [Thermosipho melanesiensis]OOC39309.1 hypothetical protein SU69_03525 [Thermosipho melanesiensis]OOC39395.1 hypothetical protein SU70_03525 [Thermosipho melanesiensis]